MERIPHFLEADLARVKALMEATLGSDIALLDATNRALQGRPGKMLRPMLALLVAGAVGKKTEDTCRYAAALELLHNATLLHDDVIDRAQSRRGLPTLYSLLGGGPAVLVGDYWLVACIRLILSAEKHVQQALNLFSSTLGHLTEGELLQMDKAEKADTTQEDYLRIVYGKTASLFELSATMGALSAGAGEDVAARMGRFACLLGTAFQIKDDIFDYSPLQEAAIGKPVGIDLQERKITQPLLCALETVSPEEAAQVRAKVAGIAGSEVQEAQVRDFVLSHGGVELAAGVMDRYITDALACLEDLPRTEEKEYLEKLACFVGDRKR